MERIITLLDAVYFGGVLIGFISEDGIDWGGDKATLQKIYAAQVRNAPVKIIKTKDATNVFTFKMIDLNADNCVVVMGGNNNAGKWEAPSGSIVRDDTMKILTGTGQTIEIGKVSLSGAVRGKIGSGGEALGIDCEAEMQNVNASPFSIYDTVPFISCATSSLSFLKTGETKTLNIEASSPFIIGAVPAGFSVEAYGGIIKVTASANSGAVRNGSVVFTLADDSTKKVTITLNQAAGT